MIPIEGQEGYVIFEATVDGRTPTRGVIEVFRIEDVGVIKSAKRVNLDRAVREIQDYDNNISREQVEERLF